MTRRCEICGKLSPARSARCECGFDFATNEVGASIERANADRARADSGIGRGIVMALIGLAGVAAAVGYFEWRYKTYGPFLVLTRQWLPLTIGLCGSMLSVVAAYGLIKIGRGVQQRVRAGRRARVADAKRALPTARIARSRNEQ